MKKITASALSLVLVAAALSGCGKTSKPASPIQNTGIVGMNGATAVDVAQTSDAITANPTLVNENLFVDSTPMVFASLGADGGVPSLHRPLRWWRTIDSTSRSVSFVYANPDSLGRPTTAIATVNRHLLGNFHVVLSDTSHADSLHHVTVKPLDDAWTRKLALQRFKVVTDSAGTNSLWRIVGTSGVLVTSAGATEHIQSVRVQSASVDTTITDPLEMHRLRRFECFHGFALVTLTVTTDKTDDVVAFYRDGDRRPFTNNGDGTYSITFVGVDFGGPRHFGVNAFANGTINTDTYPYDSQAWILPFVSRDGDRSIDRH